MEPKARAGRMTRWCLVGGFVCKLFVFRPSAPIFNRSLIILLFLLFRILLVFWTLTAESISPYVLHYCFLFIAIHFHLLVICWLWIIPLMILSLALMLSMASNCFHLYAAAPHFLFPFFPKNKNYSFTKIQDCD